MQDATAPDPEPSSTNSNCSVEHDNRQDQDENHVGAEREAEANDANCTVCGAAKASALLDLRSNHVMQRRLSRDWKIHVGTQDIIQYRHPCQLFEFDFLNYQADVIRSTLKAICVECVCKLNMHSEVTRSLMQRMQRLQRSGGETTKVTTTTTSPSQHSPPIADAEVSTTLIESQEEVAHSGQSVRSRSSCSVLEVYLAQQPYSPSAKETEEKHAEGWKWRTRLECHECGRAYFRRDYYAQHLRRCSKTRRKQPRPSRVKCRVLNEASYDEEAPSRAIRSSRIYYCRHCDAEFETLISKRQHERMKHQQRYPCDLCEAQLDTKYEWEMHHTICQAKQEVSMHVSPKNDILICSVFSVQALAIVEQQEAGQTVMTSRVPRACSMRSRSRACSEAWDRYDMDEEEEDEEDEEIESGGEELEEGEEDAMYARRMNFTGDWIVNHSRSNSNSAGNLSLLYGDYGMVETHMTTDKEYGKYPLKYVIVLYQKVLLSVFRSLPTGPAQDAGATEIIHLFHA